MSTQAKHTPGPWSAVSYVNGKIALEDDQGLGTIALVDTVHTIKDPREQEANARLIASAPELLEALELAAQALQSCYEVDSYPANGGTEQDKALATARAAIAKAKGETAS